MRKFGTVFLLAAMGLSQSQALQAAGKDNDANVTDLRSAALESEISTRIVGGERAESNAWPWQVVLYVRGKTGNFSMSCGGSLIHPGWVLTAAHCVESLVPEDYAVVEGTSHIDSLLKKKGPGRLVLVRRVMRHEDYNPQTKENDIALLELATPALAKSIHLSFPEKTPLENAGTSAIVTGWGTLQAIGRDGRDVKTGEIVRSDDPRYFTNELMQVEIPLVSEDDCLKSYPNSKIDHRAICAGLPEGGKDSCQGDSGGPLVAKAADGGFRQIGIVSFGRQCAAKEAYGVYTRVSAFQDWLQQKTQIALAKDPAAAPLAAPAGLPETLQPFQLPSAANASSVLTPVSLPVSSPVSPLTNAAGVTVSFVQGDSITVGQPVQFKVTTAKPGYLALIDITPDGKMTQIFPNARSLSSPTSGKSKSNFIEAERTVLIPDPKNPYEGFQFTADPPFGEGLLVAILSAEPLKSIAMPSAPTTLSRDEALEFLTRVTDELGRSIEIIGAGSGSTTATGKPRNWSFATKVYRIVP